MGTIKETLFKQTWWVSLAVILAGLQVVFAIGIGADSEASNTERIVIFIAFGGGAVLTLLAIRLRPRYQVRGDALIAVGVVPAFVTGIIAFWFPPLWLATAAGIAVIVSAIGDALGARSDAMAVR
jgi:hypothetical protein